MPYSRVRIPILSFFLCVCVALPAVGQQFLTTGRDTLQQLPGVEVLIEPVDAPLAEAGLNTRAIRDDVEQQLRAGGVTVFGSQTENPSSAKPYVYVQINGLPVDRQTFAIELQVHLRQTLRSPVTGSNIVNAMTWDQHTVLVVTREQIAGVREAIGEAVGEFISDWRTVH